MSSPAMKRIVCLANSRMPGGHCIAGRELWADGRPGPWVRPVSGRKNEGVATSESRYEDGNTPCLLDVMDVPVLTAQPKDHQRENWLLDLNHRWQRVQRVEPNQLTQLCDPAAPLWTNAHCSSNGRNDRVPSSIAHSFDSSLRLIRVDSLVLSVSAPWENFGSQKRIVQGRFTYGGTDYWLRVTDPVYELHYLLRRNGDYPVGECFITVSLGGPYKEYSYKLIAAVIEP